MYWTQISTDDESYNYEYFSQEDVCRLCWTKDADREILKTSNISSEILLADKIRDSIQIEVNDTHINKLCGNCYSEVDRIYSFKKFCQETDNKLKRILQKGFDELKVKNISSVMCLKSEYLEETFDKNDAIDNFFDEATNYETHDVGKKIKTNSLVRKKYLHKRSPTYCNTCCADFESKEELSLHNKEFHGIENDGTLFKCFGCEKRFKSRKTRNSHEVNFCKGLSDGYKCTLCDRFLPIRFMYEYHMRDHRHNTLTEMPEHIFKCGKCKKLFKTKEMLKKHMAEHEKEKNYVCDTCGRVFTRQDYLYKHNLTHTGVKSHHCPHCDFSAAQKSSLTVHIRKHTGERPYICDMCPQRCISSSNLRAHRRRHLGIKKYECTICSKKFGYKISLDEHISSTHVRSESHPCEHCGATYTRARGLRRHLAAKHGKLAKSKTGEENLLVHVSSTDGAKIDILKDVEYELKDGENVLLLKHQDGDVYMV